MARYDNFRRVVAQNITCGPYDAHGVALGLIVDDAVPPPDRRHPAIPFSTPGCATWAPFAATSETTIVMCVINCAAEFAEY